MSNISHLVKHFSKILPKLSYKYNCYQICRPICLTSNRLNDNKNNENNNKNNEKELKLSDNKLKDNKNEDKTSIEKTTEFTEMDENKWGPNEGVPYDPRTDEAFTSDLIQYKYPQYFTRRTKQMGLKRAVRIIKDDLSLLKEGRIHKRLDEQPTPYQVDIAIFGGGIIGSSIAHALKTRAPQSFTCAVIERDPTYTRASSTLSIGGIRQQFSLKENILMSMYSIEFLRDVKKHLSVLDAEPPDLSYHPHGYLVLATAAGAEQLIENHKLQTELGAYVELYTPNKLKEKFPWINVDDIAIGSFGVQNEGWFDPWALLVALKTKSQALGVEYIQADILDFNLRSLCNMNMSDESGGDRQHVNHVIIREPDGIVKQLEFAMGIVCCGHNSGFIAQKLEYGQRRGVRSHMLPVEPRKRYVYVFNSPEGPGIDFPLLIDPSSMFCRREGLGGNFICGRNPNESEEPDVSNLDVDYSYFDTHISGQLAHRVPAFKDLKLKGAWAGFYEYNTLDQNPIIGRDPYFGNIVWATGFSGQGIQMAPAVGRAIMELLFDGNYQTIDLSRFSWNRVLESRPLRESMVF